MLIFRPRVGSREERRLPARLRVRSHNHSRQVGFFNIVEQALALVREYDLVPSASVVEQLALSRFYADGIAVALYGVGLVAGYDDALRLLVESQHVHDHPFAGGELPLQFALLVVEVQVVVSVALALHDEEVVVPGQEAYGVHGFHVFRAGFAVEFRCASARSCVVADQPAVVLVAVQFEHVDGLAVGTPCDVREIDGTVVVLGVGRDRTGIRLQVDGRSGLHVIDAYGHLVRRLARHRVFVGHQFGYARDDVHLRIVSHHRLVHAVERHP